MPGLSAVEQERLRGRVVAEIRRLDLAALLSALDLLGYRGDRVEFRSNPTSAHTSSLFSSIELAAERALVTVNLGLMSNQGPLPSYFFMVKSMVWLAPLTSRTHAETL